MKSRNSTVKQSANQQHLNASHLSNSKNKDIQQHTSLLLNKLHSTQAKDQNNVLETWVYPLLNLQTLFLTLTVLLMTNLFRKLVQQKEKIFHQNQTIIQLSNTNNNLSSRIQTLKHKQLNNQIDPNNEVPYEYKCPITHEIMTDPVITSDGQTYERSKIQHWLNKHNTSPITGAILPNKILTPNLALKKLIVSWKEAHPDTLNENA